MKKYIVLLFIFLGTILLGITLSFNSSQAVEDDNSYVTSYIYVDIKGAVAKPGVYRVTRETRLFQLIEIAGGVTSDAFTKNVNLSIHLEDEDSIYIPFINDEISSVKEELININNASIEELDSLPGIGEVTARAIVEYRTTIGAFKKIEEIMNVAGIGEASFIKIKDYITV